MRVSHTSSYKNGNGNGNGSILGRGLKRRNLSHEQLVELAADAASGELKVVPSLSQVPAIFPGVTRAEVSAELHRRKNDQGGDEVKEILNAFAQLWSQRSPAWRLLALKHISTDDLKDVWYALDLMQVWRTSGT
jgi:hypothetical protein